MAFKQILQFFKLTPKVNIDLALTKHQLAIAEHEIQALKRRIKLHQMEVQNFKEFSPKLWFEYFSVDGGKRTQRYKALKRWEDWLENERKNGRHLINAPELKI